MLIDTRTRPAPLKRASDVAWRLLMVAAAVVLGVFALTRLWFVVLPVFIALLLSAVLVPVVTRLERRRVPTLAATWLVFGGFVATVVGVLFLIVPSIADEFSGLGETISQGVDRFQRWLVDGPLDLEQEQLDRYRREAGSRIGELLRSSSKGIVAGALAVVEGVAGFILALVLTFFFLKDGRRFQRWARSHLPAEKEELVSALAARAWTALGGYLRGAAFIGLVEAVIIGGTLWIVGARLPVPVAVLTFLGAFFPLVGAVVAGVVATQVALVSGGTGDALVVAIVALAVQQFDNDLLAPLIYGRAVNLHPAVVLITLSAGGTLGGLIGAFVAVPVAAVISAVGGELWTRNGDAWRAPSVRREEAAS
ncbi:MAG: AI-2E family transporter [Actinomycetota bacterium]